MRHHLGKPAGTVLHFASNIKDHGSRVYVCRELGGVDGSLSSGDACPTPEALLDDRLLSILTFAKLNANKTVDQGART
jgi:hypothetical protein